MTFAFHFKQNCWFLFRRVLAWWGMAAATLYFAHPTEELFARLMDFHGLRWQYEPRTFPVEWDDAGTVREAFTPDFYLPELDLYVELTMMKQSLTRRKNRKLRLLRELYPEVNVRVLYQKDLEDLRFKMGLDLAKVRAAVLHAVPS